MTFPNNDFEGTLGQQVAVANSTTWGDMGDSAYYTVRRGTYQSQAVAGGTPPSSSSCLDGQNVIGDLTQGGVFQSCYYYIPATPTKTLIGGRVEDFASDVYSVLIARSTQGLHLGVDRRLVWGSHKHYLNPAYVNFDEWTPDAGGATSPQLAIGWNRIEVFVRNTVGTSPTVSVYSGGNLQGEVPDLSWNPNSSISGDIYGVPQLQILADGVYKRYRSMYANSMANGHSASNVYADRGRMSFYQNPGPHPAYWTDPFESLPDIMEVSVNGLDRPDFDPVSFKRYVEAQVVSDRIASNGSSVSESVNVSSVLTQTHISEAESNLGFYTV